MMRDYIAQFTELADQAAPFMDASWTGSGWKPSELLRIGFFTLLSGPKPERSAQFANDMLEAARDLHRRGLSANPFGEA
jgi:hypothetical protein